MKRVRHKTSDFVAQRRSWTIFRRTRYPLAILKRRARLRQLVMPLLAYTWLPLGLSLWSMLTTGGVAAAGCVVLVSGLNWMLHSFCDGPKTRRSNRIVADRRPVLRRRVLVVPPQRREARILRSRPSPIVLSLPPSRPRSRALPRRPALLADESE